MFGRRKSVPKIVTDDFELSYVDNSWSFEYQSIPFSVLGHEINLPTLRDLNNYLDWVNKHKEYIDIQVAAAFKGWDKNINLSAAHIAHIEIENNDSISVMILGDSSWGDMGYDLWFKSGDIVNEGASD